MRLLAFVDVHTNIEAMKKIEAKAKKGNPDFLICLGDVSIFEEYLDVVMQRFSRLNRKFLVIHGNHESENVMRKICSFYDNTTFVHKKIHYTGDFAFVGFGGGGFSLRDEAFERFVKESGPKIRNKKIILLTHAPPHNTALDNLHGEHCGNKSITEFIKNNKGVVLALSGHFHETAGKEDHVSNARLLNPGPYGKIINI